MPTRPADCPSEVLKITREEFNKLVDDVAALVTLANELKADHNALLAKLDADTGVADVDYATLHSVEAADVSATAEKAKITGE